MERDLPKSQTPNSTASPPQPETVAFEHMVFSRFAECLFYLAEGNQEFVLSVKIGGNPVILPVAGLIREFGLGKADTDMLALVREGCDFVRGLRIGDPIPKEVLTGEASWAVSPKHQIIARQRVLMQLVNWMTGVDTLLTSPEQLAQMVNDPATKKKINEAFGEAAERLGLGRENREKIVPYVEKLTLELAYIEALRDTVRVIASILEKIEGLYRLYRRQAALAQTIEQVRKLMLVAIGDFNDRLAEIDAQTGEIIAVLKNLENQVLYIREKRDDLFKRLMAWEPIIKEWRTVDVAVSMKMDDVIRRIYQFLAARFMKTDEWVLMTQLQMRSESVEDLTKKKKVLVW